MDVLRPLSTGVSSSGGPNQHPFVPIEYRVSIRIAARRMHVGDAIFFGGGSSPR
ncbi:hypothetical protein X777_16936 [Ooceraea biroi]|uniref:Uncharacterized protein n=1 Tax=Ooceraea biroi TaxID=2015173 RepID=A0A026WSG8_OOCBI|nr:hypothetical protein X777_16936 [Ooceraea biroi]